MSFLDIAKNRYTTKEYNSDRSIPEPKIEELKEILRLSPSSINSQPWKFIFISDEKVKKELADASYWNNQRISDSSHLVIFSVIDNIKHFEEGIKEYLPEGNLNYYKQFLKPKDETVIKSWLQNQVYLSLGFFLSACATLGIDSTPMEGIQNEEYDKILHLEGYKTLFAVAIGFRNTNDSNQPSITAKSRLPLKQIIQSI